MTLLVDQEKEDVGPAGRRGLRLFGGSIASDRRIETGYAGCTCEAEFQGRAPVDVTRFAHGLSPAVDYSSQKLDAAQIEPNGST
jgi:hypothetical protein